MRAWVSPVGGIVVSCAFLVACAPLAWERPDTDAATADDDLLQCEQVAKSAARRYPGRADQPAVVVSGRGEVGVTVPPASARSSDPVAEYDALTACMRAKGYRQRSAP